MIPPRDAPVNIENINKIPAGFAGFLFLISGVTNKKMGITGKAGEILSEQV